VVALGLVLLVLCVLLVLGIVLNNDGPVQAEAFGVSLDNVSVGGLFLVGVGVGSLLMIALGLVLVGSARKRHKKVAAKREVNDVKGERESLAEENARLQAELERTTHASTTPVPEAARHHGGDAPRSGTGPVRTDDTAQR
jgi:uncharacterized integral membrane protein